MRLYNLMVAFPNLDDPYYKDHNAIAVVKEESMERILGFVKRCNKELDEGFMPGITPIPRTLKGYAHVIEQMPFESEYLWIKEFPTLVL